VNEFRSHHERGAVFRRPLDAEAARLSQGVSVSDDPGRPKARSARNPDIGTFLATLRIEDNGPVALLVLRG